MYNNGQLTGFLRTASLWVGILVFIISGYLSYDGFDGSVGATGVYTTAGKVIGAIFAVTVGILQFIYATDAKELNKTLKVLGLLSYSYSIYTNKLGAENILLMSENMAWATALIADVAAEPMIAWGLGEALTGDFVGNFLAMFSQNNKNNTQNNLYRTNLQTDRPTRQTSFIHPEIRNKIGNNRAKPNQFRYEDSEE